MSANSLKLKVRLYYDNYLTLEFTWTVYPTALWRCEASYAVSEIIGKNMISHTIAETVILSACQEMVAKSTEISGKTERFVFIRFIESGTLKKKQKNKTCSNIIFSFVQICMRLFEFVQMVHLQLMEASKAFVSLASGQNLDIISSPGFYGSLTQLKTLLDMMVKIVNYINMRLLKCRQSAKLMENMQTNHTALTTLYFLGNETGLTKLPYLDDIFQELNSLNLNMLRRNKNILMSTAKINSFYNNLTIWSNLATAGNVEMFKSIELKETMVE
ncbi:hypothetical protein RF11_15932 [Thelohanellus kitauei]|uniref:Uncharacterized protein n=1 Tax=Thelohanellus kitauei TaxID=669202 RepID=A0A0C2J8N1_THEKT|nr:hypothetical protein RF11_15932 [Thelohanellus kitauei]